MHRSFKVNVLRNILIIDSHATSWRNYFHLYGNHKLSTQNWQYGPYIFPYRYLEHYISSTESTKQQILQNCYFKKESLQHANLIHTHASANGGWLVTYDFPILIMMSTGWSWLSISCNTIICVGSKSIFTLIQNDTHLYKCYWEWRETQGLWSTQSLL